MGSAMHRCAVPRFTEVVGAAARSIFSSAFASAMGLRVSSAPDASARYSRRRDTIIASVCADEGASTIATIQKTEQDRPSATALVFAAAFPAATGPVAQAAAGPVGQQRDGADHRRNHRHQANVEVAHVAQLVRHHSLQLVTRYRIEQAAGDRNGRMLGIAAGGKRVGIRVGNHIHPGLGQTRRNAHLLDHVVELPDFQGLIFAGRSGKGALHRNGARGQQNRPISGVIAGQGRHGSPAKRRQAADRERELAVTDVEDIEAQPQKQEKCHEHKHDRPRAPAVRRLLLEEIARQTYFLIERSTAGTSRSAASVISNSSAALKPRADANMFEGNVCCAVLNVVAMSL